MSVETESNADEEEEEKLECTAGICAERLEAADISDRKLPVSTNGRVNILEDLPLFLSTTTSFAPALLPRLRHALVTRIR
jgi:hypothetical protein